MNEEKSFIIKNYRTMYAKDVAKKLNRSPRAVFDFARKRVIKILHSNGKI